MRSLACLAVAATFCAPAAVHARAFWQTYGATVPSPAGCAGCSWNVNFDYFVPRTCETGRYDLFSPCKTSHYLSPACKNLHPIYGGYCTPYGACHYKRRDHVYKKHCGCTPLKHTYGPWHLTKCQKHCGVLRPEAALRGAGCVASGCSDCFEGADCGPAGFAGYGEFAAAAVLPNVEPIGGQRLGEVAALPAAMVGGSGMPMTGSPAMALPAMPQVPMAAPSSGFTFPGFGN